MIIAFNKHYHLKLPASIFLHNSLEALISLQIAFSVALTLLTSIYDFFLI